MHYVDRGHGPAIVLLHGSFGSLHMWNDWDRELGSHYRVIRFDRPRMGLSGASPAGRTDTEQELQIIDELTRHLGVERFFLVGTSSAGVAAAAYAADHPQQIRGLLLANVAVGAFKPATVQRPLLFFGCCWRSIRGSRVGGQRHSGNRYWLRTSMRRQV
ncbi:MAG: alpha/beta fold hydrolase [Proteobacteria bacterium]|nr:alpha/beta fold hydrolase [Pseudomonadota bacterium]